MKAIDTINFISKLNRHKIENAIKVTSSYYLSKWTKRPCQWGFPVTVSIEPTTHCNLGCPECPSGLKSFTRPTGNLEFALYKKTIEEIGDQLIYLYFYFQGEPYLHPGFMELVKYAANKKIYTVASTNAHFLSERKAYETVRSGLDRILISIDGVSQQTYEQYRVGGKLTKVIEGTRNLIKAKRELKSKTPHIIFQFLVVKPNEHEVEQVIQLGRELGVDETKIKTAQICNFENGNGLIPLAKKYSRYRQQADGKYLIKNKLLNHCWKLWHSCVITWDGRVVPCCFDKDAQHQLGDLNSSAFHEIWNNESYRHFRTSLLKGRKEIDICTNCSEGTKVWS